jgi:hypothetical protein
MARRGGWWRRWRVERDHEAEAERVVLATEVVVEQRRGRRRVELRVLPPGVLIFGEQRNRRAETLSVSLGTLTPAMP